MNEFLRQILNLPPQASRAAWHLDLLHYFVITITMIGATAVFVVALIFLVRYRRRGDELTPRVNAPWRLEATQIGLTLGLFLLWWVIGFRQYLNMSQPPANALEVYVTAKQWMWKFAYPNGRGSVGVLAVPVGRPVRLIMTSRDVIHSLFVPAFRVKQDVVPGRYLVTWFEAVRPGTYDLFCAEYCGLSHSRMRASVLALPPGEYASWLEQPSDNGSEETTTEQRLTASGNEGQGRGNMAVQGRLVAARRGCLACHTLDGQRHIGPTWRGLYGSVVTLSNGETVVADEAYLTRSMMDPEFEIVDGFSAVMPTYRGLLQAPEAAALVEFIKSLRGPAKPTMPTLPEIPPDAIVPADASGEAHIGAQIQGNDHGASREVSNTVSP